MIDEQSCAEFIFLPINPRIFIHKFEIPNLDIFFLSHNLLLLLLYPSGRSEWRSERCTWKPGPNSASNASSISGSRQWTPKYRRSRPKWTPSSWRTSATSAFKIPPNWHCIRLDRQVVRDTFAFDLCLSFSLRAWFSSRLLTNLLFIKGLNETRLWLFVRRDESLFGFFHFWNFFGIYSDAFLSFGMKTRGGEEKWQSCTIWFFSSNGEVEDSCGNTTSNGMMDEWCVSIKNSIYHKCVIIIFSRKYAFLR